MSGEEETIRTETEDNDTPTGIYARVPRDLDEEFRKGVVDIHKARRGFLQKGLIEAVQFWLAIKPFRIRTAHRPGINDILKRRPEAERLSLTQVIQEALTLWIEQHRNRINGD